jgi:hypothetical protein
MLGYLNSNVVAYEDGDWEEIICRPCANTRFGVQNTDRIRLGIMVPGAENVRGVSEVEIKERGIAAGLGPTPVCDRCWKPFGTIAQANGWSK